MQDNTSRGNRVVFWSKILLLLLILVSILFLVNNRVFMSGFAAPPKDATIPVLQLLLFLGTGLVCLACFFSCVIHWVFWLSWMYHAEENLRKITHTAFSPWGAVALCFIPFLGQLLHYFVFRDIVKHTEQQLAVREVITAKVPMSFVNAFFALILASGILLCFGRSDLLVDVRFVLWIVSLGCFLRALLVLVVEEQALYQTYQEEVLRAKVDQVLREREIEAAASKVVEAVVPPKDEP